MVSSRVRNAYKQTATITTEADPIKLIHMMYERSLAHLLEAKNGIIQKDPKKRGENLGKAIAIITELYVSVKQEDASEAAVFLRGLYEAILLQLPKVSVSNDTAVIDRAFNYIQRLKEIWEQTAMRESGDAGGRENKQAAAGEAENAPQFSPGEAKTVTARVSVSI